MPETTLIYNLFPPLVGSIPHWEEHLDRIAAMGFTWIFLNPIHVPAFPGRSMRSRIISASTRPSPAGIRPRTPSLPWRIS